VLKVAGLPYDPSDAVRIITLYYLGFVVSCRIIHRKFRRTGDVRIKSGTLDLGDLALSARRKSVIRTLIALFGLLAVVWVFSGTILYRAMERPPEAFARFMTKLPIPLAFMVLPFETLWTHARAGSLQIGDRAPDFSLVKVDKTAQIRFSDFTAQQRPVVLIFGSYT